ncbi:MAG: hypothetical protein OXG96_15170 [Acidobacteria bacterium]|nr:hypothetical protein [Acidobacteriota bacterium]
MPTLTILPEARISLAAGGAGLLEARVLGHVVEGRPPWPPLEGVETTTGEGIQCE